MGPYQEAALHEMLFSGGTLNAKLLGGEAVEADRRADFSTS